MHRRISQNTLIEGLGEAFAIRRGVQQSNGEVLRLPIQ